MAQIKTITIQVKKPSRLPRWVRRLYTACPYCGKRDQRPGHLDRVHPIGK